MSISFLLLSSSFKQPQLLVEAESIFRQLVIPTLPQSHRYRYCFLSCKYSIIVSLPCFSPILSSYLHIFFSLFYLPNTLMLTYYIYTSFLLNFLTNPNILIENCKLLTRKIVNQCHHNSNTYNNSQCCHTPTFK